MVRDQEFNDEEEDEIVDESEEEEPEPQKRKLMGKTSPQRIVTKPNPPQPAKQQAPAQQMEVAKIPVFESQAMQVFYDLIAVMNNKINQIKTDIELIKKLAQE